MNILYLLPIIILIAGAIIIGLIGRFVKKETAGMNLLYAIIANVSFLAVLGLIISFYGRIMAGIPVEDLYLQITGTTYSEGIYTIFRIDQLTWWFMLVFTLIGSIVSIYSIKYMDRDDRLDRYYLLLLLLVAGMIGVVVAGDLLTLFIFWEFMSIASYVLVSFRKEEPEPIEAGIKYLFMSAFGSVILLFGMSLLYGITGTLNIAAIGTLLSGATLGGVHVVIIICLIIGFGVKAAIIP
ncbi:MAG: hypothetical protein KAQ95_06410, partial [Candidatus Heimdallarchaeota archaeon]|nr:hypothetical protein [Candidatus Heimdallarchaeota archaeon]